MKNVYGDWEGYMERIRLFEKSGESEALFPLPNGKKMGEATPKEIEEFRASWEEHQGITREDDSDRPSGGG